MSDDADLRLPRRALPYVVLQRLETQRLGAGIHYSALGRAAYALYERVPFADRLYGYYSTRIEPVLRGASIRAAYARTMRREFETIRPHLPEAAERIVGIGPGVAGLEVLISKFYRAQFDRVPELVLVDRDRIDQVYYGFRERAAAYNSLTVAREALVLNGHPPQRIAAVDADAVSVDDIRPADLITSLIAWGFHFPVATYLELARSALTPGGRLIIDVRRGTGGLEELQSAFGLPTIIHEDPKFVRVLVKKM